MLAAVPDKTPNWADRAKPFLRDTLKALGAELTYADVETALGKLTPPKTVDEFLIDSSTNTILQLTGNIWVTALFPDKIKEHAKAKLPQLYEIFGGKEQTVLALIGQDLNPRIEAFEK